MQPALSLNISQKVAMTPQLAESIRFLQLSAEELADELKAALEENVMLEIDEERREEPSVSIESDYAVREQWSTSIRGNSDDDYDFTERLIEAEDRVAIRILKQLEMRFADRKSLRIASAIVDATAATGYLETPVAVIANDLSLEEPVSTAEVERVLHAVQRLDPIAFGARDLRECLLIQLEEVSRRTPGRDLARAIVADQMDALARMDLQVLSRKLSACEEDVAEAIRLIRSLDPKPAADEAAASAVIPDVFVQVTDEGSFVHLNNAAVPSLRINPEYERVVATDSQAKALRGQLQEARWLLRSVEMRNDTLLRATQYIFECQQEFLARGETALKPLTLRQVADAIGVHESTISRITTSKYVQTPHGVFSLKAFFPSQLVTAEGVSASGAAVKAMIQKLISGEEPGNPLRDVDLAAILARRGVKIARRTIAKYREALGIASSKDRVEEYRIKSVVQRRVHRSVETRLAS